MTDAAGSASEPDPNHIGRDEPGPRRFGAAETRSAGREAGSAGIVRCEPLVSTRAVRGPFDYLRPSPDVGVGTVLDVPFGGRRVSAVVTGLATSSEHSPAEPLRVHEDRIPPDLVELALWLAGEYASTPARALALVTAPRGVREKTVLWAARTEAGDAALAAQSSERLTAGQRAALTALPARAGDSLGLLRRLERRGLAEIGPSVVRRAPRHAAVERVGARPALTAAQRSVLDAIATAEPGGGLLLHGVTGSGKTEVYLQAAERALAAGEGVLILVPEIGLTPQMIGRVVARFGETVAVLHSGLSAGARYDEWRRLRSGHARICVGPRSAVFAPLRSLGLIVVDEEHDSSYKHEGDPRYDARTVAGQRARMHGAVLVAGSATPRPESVLRLPRLRLDHRADGATLPPVTLIDLKSCKGAIHPQVHEALVDARKAIVLLNRRGWSNFLTCGGCGRVWGCPHCDVALVVHRAEDVIACHHCGHREPLPRACPDCGSVSIARHGAGTERLERDLSALGRPVLRFDAGVRDPGAVLARFAAAERAILVGTQVVAKGHDFPDVDLGVVLDADATLRFPDFRAQERTFALVTQLAGRAGRGRQGSRVLVQTIDPEDETLRLAAAHDADGFLAAELRRREALRYPPYSTLIRVHVSAPVAADAGRAAAALKQRLPQAMGPAPLFRLRGRERRQLVLKAPAGGDGRREAIAAVSDAVAAVARECGRVRRDIRLFADVDPQ